MLPPRVKFKLQIKRRAPAVSPRAPLRHQLESAAPCPGTELRARFGPIAFGELGVVEPARGRKKGAHARWCLVRGGKRVGGLLPHCSRQCSRDIQCQCCWGVRLRERPGSARNWVGVVGVVQRGFRVGQCWNSEFEKLSGLGSARAHQSPEDSLSPATRQPMDP